MHIISSKYLLILLLLLSYPANAQIYKWVDEDGRTQFSDKPNPGAQLMSISDDKPSPVEDNKEDHDKDIKISHVSLLDSNVLRLRRMLIDQDYKSLNKAIDALEKSFNEQLISEDKYITAYDAFALKAYDLLPLFDLWVESNPDNYQPYIARGVYQYHLGWHARGSKWASETDDEQMRKLSEYLDKSSNDLYAGLQKRNDILVAYYYLMRVSTTEGMNDEVARLMTEALDILPASYLIRAQYLKSLTPRWGGSIEAMEKFLKDSEGDMKKYPDLKLLYGYVYNRVGDEQALVKKYNVADKVYSKSLDYGIHRDAFFGRGKNNVRRKEYKQSIDDLTKAIQLNDEIAEYYYWRAAALAGLNDFDQAMIDIKRAELLDPYDTDIRKKKKWISTKFNSDGFKLTKSQQPESAIDKFTSAIRLDGNNAEMYYGRASAYIQQRNLDLALSDLKKAIELDPHDIDFYRLIDYVLTKSQRWDQIISYWDKFIVLHPDNGTAYVERGGAYYHKGDIKSAVADAKRSADLGNLEGIEAYDKFKKHVR